MGVGKLAKVRAEQHRIARSVQQGDLTAGGEPLDDVKTVLMIMFGQILA